MPRYILIDHRSGYIRAVNQAANPLSACQIYDRASQRSSRKYEVVDQLTPNDPAYRVYHADDDLPLITDGEDLHVIERVEHQCSLAALIRFTEPHWERR